MRSLGQLSTMHFDKVEFNALSAKYKQTVDEVRRTVESHVGLLQEYRPFGRSAYGARKDLDLEREACACKEGLKNAATSVEE